LRDHFDDQLPARLGGEEFAILFTALSDDQVLEQLENFRESLENDAVEYADETIHFTISIGLCLQPEEQLDGMIKLADQALYAAKSAGRNKIIRYDDCSS
jgi:diguanylate cyclase (GGDEF)-like protein